MRKYSLYEYIPLLLLSALKSTRFYANPYREAKRTTQYQTQKIKKLITHAYNNTEFYYKKYKSAGVSPDDFTYLEDIQKFPTVTKEEMIENFSRKNTSNLTDHKQYVASVSSGSSGKVITVFHDPKDTWAYLLGRYRILNINRNYHFFDKSLYIYTSTYPAQSFFGLYKSFFIPTLNDLSDTVNKIKIIRPKIISSYPSQMIELQKFLSAKDAKKLHLKLISLGSELSSKAQREQLAGYFNCSVYDEYSSEELGWIAGECTERNYHLWEDIAFTEILERESDNSVTDGQEGEIVGTNLHNLAMPFIRYRQGDIGTIESNKQCPCGRKFRILKDFQGRKNDRFLLSDGSVLTPAYLLDSIYELLLGLKIDIADFCLIQEAKNKAKLEIIPGKAFHQNDTSTIHKKLQELLSDKIMVEINLVDKLHKTFSGKRNPIISYVQS